MSRLKVEDYLEQGIHGPKEIKAGERREFSGHITGTRSHRPKKEAKSLKRMYTRR
ncbi:hypothetical protein RCO48_31690 [Peribacillus frigoritolerans]|nr:hypothetical protein [Peribacillus frigoritolerans]